MGVLLDILDLFDQTAVSVGRHGAQGHGAKVQNPRTSYRLGQMKRWVLRAGMTRTAVQDIDLRLFFELM